MFKNSVVLGRRLTLLLALLLVELPSVLILPILWPVLLPLLWLVLLRRVTLLRRLMIWIGLARALRVRRRGLIIGNLSPVLRLLAPIPLLRALLIGLLGRPLSARVVDRDPVVLIQRRLVDPTSVVGHLRRRSRGLKLTTIGATRITCWPGRASRIGRCARQPQHTNA
ncbi:hypothetical protein MYCSP_08185 [Mycobacteroides saopaulense]|nr:hypothetical protein MYCSP_08185 [Mycobacteroides saopaulense]